MDEFRKRNEHYWLSHFYSLFPYIPSSCYPSVVSSFQNGPVVSYLMVSRPSYNPHSFTITSELLLGRRIWQKVTGYQFPDEIIKPYDHHLAYILSCFLGLLVSMKQAAVSERPKW